MTRKHTLYLTTFLLLTGSVMAQSFVTLSGVLYPNILLSLFDVTTERVTLDQGKRNKNYERDQESMDFRVTLTPKRGFQEKYNVTVEVVVKVKNEWSNEILGNVYQGQHIESYQAQVVIPVEGTDPEGSYEGVVQLGAILTNAEYSFSGGYRRFQKEILDVRTRMVRGEPR